MAQTMKKIDYGSNAGDRTSGSLGGFDSVAGTLYRRYGGGKKTSDSGRGWSYAIQTTAQSGQFIFNSTTDTTYRKCRCVREVFYNWLIYSGNNSGCFAMLDATTNQVGKTIQVGFKADVGGTGASVGKFVLEGQAVAGGPINTGVDIPPPGKTFYISIALNRTTTNTWQFDVAYRMANSLTWVAIWSLPATNIGQDVMQSFWVGNALTSGASSKMVGRLGTSYVMAITDYPNEYRSEPTGADAMTDADDLPFTWYFSSTGNDANDGATSGTPWATTGKITSECVLGTIRRSWARHGYVWADGSEVTELYDRRKIDFLEEMGYIKPGGDIVLLQYAGGIEHRFAEQLDYSVPGTGLDTDADFFAGQETRFTFFKVVPVASWSLTATKSATWETTDTQTNARLFQNRRDLTRVGGANYAAVAATIEATAGTYYNDGTKIYVHPLDGVNPTTAGTDGVFERTRTFGVQNNDHAIVLSSFGQRIRGWNGSGTAEGQANTTSSVGGYTFAMGSGISIISRCTSDYSDKHGFGNVNNVTHGRRTIYRDCDGLRGNREGDQSIFVDYLPHPIIGNGTAGAAVASNSTLSYSAWPSLAVGQKLILAGWSNGANNGTFTITAINSSVITVNSTSLVVEAAASGKTVRIDGFNNQARYVRCSIKGGNGIRSNSSDPVRISAAAYITHGNGGPTILDYLDFEDCNFTQAGGLDIQSGTCITEVRNCQLSEMKGQVGTTFINTSFDRPGAPVGTYENCKMRLMPTSLDSTKSGSSLGNGAIANGLYQDGRYYASNLISGAIWNFTASNKGVSNVTFKRTRFILRNGIGVFSAANATCLRPYSGESHVISACIFYLASVNSPILPAYDDGVTVADRTLAEAQALGIADAACRVIVVNASVDLNELVPPELNINDALALGDIMNENYPTSGFTTTNLNATTWTQAQSITPLKRLKPGDEINIYIVAGANTGNVLAEVLAKRTLNDPGEAMPPAVPIAVAPSKSAMVSIRVPSGCAPSTLSLMLKTTAGNGTADTQISF